MGKQDVLKQLLDLSVENSFILKSLNEASKDDVSKSLDKIYNKKGTKAKQVDNFNNLFDFMIEQLQKTKRVFNEKFDE